MLGLGAGKRTGQKQPRWPVEECKNTYNRRATPDPSLFPLPSSLPNPCLFRYDLHPFGSMLPASGPAGLFFFLGYVFLQTLEKK